MCPWQKQSEATVSHEAQQANTAFPPIYFVGFFVKAEANTKRCPRDATFITFSCLVGCLKGVLMQL